MGRFDDRALLAILLLSRFVGGAGGASTGIVQAFVGDAVVPEERAKALGWISASTSAGIVLGPALGSLATRLGPAFPGLIAAALCALNLVLARRYLPESTSHETRADARSSGRGSVRERMREVLRHPRQPVARLIWIYALGMMAFMASNAMLALFLQARFGFTERSIGWAYSLIGVVGLLMRSVVLDPAVRAWGERGAMRLGLSALAVSFALQPFVGRLELYAFVVVLVPVGTALLFPANSSLVSRFAPRKELGAAMGVQQTYGGLSRLVAPLWAGWAFQELGAGSPFLICAGLMAATWLFALGLEAPPRAKAAPVAAEPAAEGASA
jgi:predicted MFS family arabinose efflux permease